MAEDKSLDNLASSIAADVAALDNTVRGIARESQTRYRCSMEPGQTLPEFGEYEAADDEARGKIRAAASHAIEEVMGDIDLHLSKKRRVMSAPASADDCATVQLALSRENISEDEYIALLERYGKNHTLASSIRERAAKDHVYLSGAPFVVDREEAEHRAKRSIIERHNDSYGRKGSSSWSTPEFVASYILEGLTHTDILGRTW